MTRFNIFAPIDNYLRMQRMSDVYEHLADEAPGGVLVSTAPGQDALTEREREIQRLINETHRLTMAGAYPSAEILGKRIRAVLDRVPAPAPAVEQREVLAEALRGHVGCCVDCPVPHTPEQHAEQAGEIADVLLALPAPSPQVEPEAVEAVIATAEERDALPTGVVVRSSAGTIAARFDSKRGVLFGVDATFDWSLLALPATVLWSPTALASRPSVALDDDLELMRVQAYWSPLNEAGRAAVNALIDEVARHRASRPSVTATADDTAAVDAKALIEAERRRQVEGEGWSAEHDREHGAGVLYRAAWAYLRHGDKTEPPRGWPWDREWWKPKDAVRDATRAGALALAGIDVAQGEFEPLTGDALYEIAVTRLTTALSTSTGEDA